MGYFRRDRGTLNALGGKCPDTGFGIVERFCGGIVEVAGCCVTSCTVYVKRASGWPHLLQQRFFLGREEVGVPPQVRGRR